MQFAVLISPRFCGKSRMGKCFGMEKKREQAFTVKTCPVIYSLPELSVFR